MVPIYLLIRLVNYRDIPNEPAERGIIPMPGRNYVVAGAMEDPSAGAFLTRNQDGFIYNSVTKQTLLYMEPSTRMLLVPSNPCRAEKVQLLSGIRMVSVPVKDLAGLKDIWIVRLG